VTDWGETPFPAAEVTLATGAEPVDWKRVESRGYGLVNAHWLVGLDDGRSAFVKHALTKEAVSWLRRERLVYESVHGRFMPEYLGAHDAGGTTLLVIEDLTVAEWPPPWSPQRIHALLASLAALRERRPPAELPALDDLRDRLGGWAQVARDPEPLLSTGLCSRAWLHETLPDLIRAVEEADLAGEELLHLDVRSDNLCFLDDEPKLVDWNLACRGNGVFDIVCWLPSLHLEGGPEPWELLPDAGLLSAVIAGFFASRAGLEPPPGAPTVREFQRAQAEAALPWVARELGLPAPF
jgi:hypothetical protein